MPIQAGLQTNPHPPFPYLQVGKVVGVHRRAHAVDVMLLGSAALLTEVPLLSWGGSSWGLAGPMASTVSRTVLGRKTYPVPPNIDNYDWLFPLANTATARDVYVVVAQLEGSQRGLSGFVAIGCLFPQIAEMHFDGLSWPDLLLFRHPSDVQVTLDRWGSLAIQHPTGGRLSLELRPEPEVAPGDGTPLPNPVDLTAADVDTLYQLRDNLPVSIPANGRKPELLLSVPHWWFEDPEEVTSGVILAGITADNPRGYLPTPAGFCVSGTLPTDVFGAVGLEGGPAGFILEIAGFRRQLVATAPWPGGGTVAVVSPGLPIIPTVGTPYTLTKVGVHDAGRVSLWLTNTGDLVGQAFWMDKEGGKHGRIHILAGELHTKTVAAGDIFETAHPSEEAGGCIRNRADIDHQTSAGETNRMENDAGASLVMEPDGTIKMVGPKDIWITARGILHLDGALILENMGGVGGSAEGGEEQDGDGEDQGGMFPFMDSGGEGGGNTGGFGGFGGGFGGNGGGGGLFPF